ncbi:type II secretion system protein [Salinimonas lutimaris]|uniref:type II secretion system protein n=1 Tax=Salinimonas lutimaris TaxID=914153 RepID=UPI0010C05419|nr:type II secretion system protein [Salinimonas lutimaris]
MKAAISSAPARASAGFTLVELIVTIVIVGVLAVVALPRFADTSGYTEFTYQKRVLAALRAMQYKAMQDTRTGFCHQLNFATGSDPAFGPATMDYSAVNQATTCQNTIDFSAPEALRTDTGEIQADGVTMSVLDSAGTAISSLGFDNLGRPVTADCSTASGCTITFSAQASAAVCVTSQGWIHAC